MAKSLPLVTPAFGHTDVSTDYILNDLSTLVSAILNCASGRLPATAPNGLQRIYPLDLSVGSIRWIYPLDLSVESGRWRRHQPQPAGQHFAHSISSGDGLDWDCPLLLLSPPPRGAGSDSLRRAPCPRGVGGAGTGPRATAYYLS